MKLLLKTKLFFYLFLLLFGHSLSAVKDDVQKKYEALLQAIDQGDEVMIKTILFDACEAKKILRSQSIAFLHYALAQNHLNIAKILIALGSPLNLYDAQKWTPLHWAAVHNYHEIFVILKERGADIFALDGDRLTPYDHACILFNGWKIFS
jgi:ankyrin repeat protein